MAVSDWLLERVEELADAIEPFARAFSTKRLRRMEDVARRLSDAYANLHMVVRDELERRGELPPCPRGFTCTKCERSWDNARDLVEHACSRAPAEHDCDCESTAQPRSASSCASQRDELAPRSGALEPGETTDGPKRSGG